MSGIRGSLPLSGILGSRMSGGKGIRRGDGCLGRRMSGGIGEGIRVSGGIGEGIRRGGGGFLLGPGMIPGLGPPICPRLGIGLRGRLLSRKFLGRNMLSSSVVLFRDYFHRRY
jgi:hypothetical protein